MRSELNDAAWLNRQFAAGRSVVDVAAELGCTDRAVYRAAARLGVDRPQARRTTIRRPLLDDEKWLRAQRAAGMTPRHIARHLGVTIPEVVATLDRFGLPHHHQTPRMIDRAEVHQMPDEGMSIYAIVKTTNVSRATIRRIAAKRPA